VRAKQLESARDAEQPREKEDKKPRGRVIEVENGTIDPANLHRERERCEEIESPPLPRHYCKGSDNRSPCYRDTRGHAQLKERLGEQQHAEHHDANGDEVLRDRFVVHRRANQNTAHRDTQKKRGYESKLMRSSRRTHRNAGEPRSEALR
jgi:hypothetical protein